MKKTTFLTIFVCVLAIFALYTLQTIADQHASKSEQNLNFEKQLASLARSACPPVPLLTQIRPQHGVKLKISAGSSHSRYGTCHTYCLEDRIFIQTAIKGEMPKTQTQNTEAEKST